MLTAASSRLVEVLVKPPATSDNVVLFSTTKWLIVVACADKVHLVVVSIDIVVDLVPVTLIVTFVAHIVVMAIVLISLQVINSFPLLFVDNICLLLILCLEDTQSVKIEDSTNFNIELPLNFDLFLLR